MSTALCRSTHLPTAELPSAAELVAAALKVLRSNPDVLPCNRLAVSTNVFVPMRIKPGSLSRLFSPQGKPARCTDGGEETRVVLAGSAKRARFMESVPPESVQSCAVSTCALVTASTASAATVSHPQQKPSLLQIVHLQGQVHEEAGASEGAPGLTANDGAGSGDVKDMDCHSWLERVAPGEDASACVADDGACEHAHSMNSLGNVQYECSVPQSQSAGCPSAAVGERLVHQMSQHGQACAPTLRRTNSCTETVSNVGRGLKDALLSLNGKGEMQCVDIGAGAVTHPGAHRAKHTDPTSDHQESIDIAEQRRMYYLIQMQARHRRQGKYVSPDPVARRASQSGTRHAKPAGKQTSILSLLNKK